MLSSSRPALNSHCSYPCHTPQHLASFSIYTFHCMRAHTDIIMIVNIAESERAPVFLHCSSIHPARSIHLHLHPWPRPCRTCAFACAAHPPARPPARRKVATPASPGISLWFWCPGPSRSCVFAGGALCGGVYCPP